MEYLVLSQQNFVFLTSQVFFAIPPNSASYGLLEEFLFIFQRYKISTTLTDNLLERCQHFTTVPK